jgi:hypothetical protein
LEASVLGLGVRSPALPDSGVPSDGLREPVGGGVDDIVQPDMLVEARAYDVYYEIQKYLWEMVIVEIPIIKWSIFIRRF